MGRDFFELERSEQLLLVGHLLNAVGVLFLSFGTILRTAGSLPQAPHARGFSESQADSSALDAREYF